MALDKLVDSTQLDACCTAEANAIRAKTGGSSQIAFDWANSKGFADAIAAIPSGGGAIKGVTTLKISSTSETSFAGSFPDLTVLQIDNLNTFSIQTIDITAGSAEIAVEAGGSGQAKGGALKTIDLHGAKVVVSQVYGLRYRENLETINAKLRMTVTNTSNQFTSTTKLKDVLWQENKQTSVLCFASCPLLTDASLVSIANGLSGTTVNTLTLHATPKARCASIMGTVSQVTSGGETYDFFTADENGTVSLQSFITTTKGWTLA